MAARPLSLARMNRLYFVRLVLAAMVLGAACTPAPQDEPVTVVTEDVPPPPAIPYAVVKEYPHDPKAYTQGLVWHNGYLLEGTGQYKESNVRRVDLATGKVKQQTRNTDEIFGEGITVLNGKLYQISWREQKGFVYDAASLKQLQEFTLPTQEGWGLTNNGQELILSDGTSNLYFLDPASFRETRRVGVYDNMGPRVFINELEYINGFVYANIWQTDFIVKIDPNSGRIVGRADLSDLRGKTGIPAPGTDEKGPDVLNGIAWDSTGKRIFITGKYWPKLFEVKLDQ